MRAIEHGTVARMFWHGVMERGPQVILRQKDLGIWRAMTWSQLGAAAREVGMGLVALGFEPGEVASIQSNTNREWLFADLGILGAGGVSNGIYPTDAAAQAEYLLADSSSVVVFVEDEEQLDKILEVRERLPKLRKIIVFDMEGLRDFDDRQVMSLEALRALGADYDEKHEGVWDKRLASRQAGDLAILVYTSGTTGKPKGAMISHRNILATLDGYQDAFPQGPAGRTHGVPAALPHRRAARRPVPLALLRRGAELRGEPGDGPGERARDRAHHLHRRAARVGEVLLGRADPAQGGGAPAAVGLRHRHRHRLPRSRR